MADKENKEQFSMSKENYRLIIIGVVIVLIGFVLMMGGKSEDPNGCHPEGFSFRRITLAPITVMVGYMFVIYAIMKKPKGS